MKLGNSIESDLNQAFVGNDVYHDNDPNEIWKVWKSIFLSIADKHAPLRQRKVRSNYNPWITAEIKNLGHRRDFLKKKAVTHNSICYFNQYKKCRNNLNKTIKKTKSNYYKTKLNSCKDHKENWKLINELLNNVSKTTIINELIVDENKIIGDENIANEFNKFFSCIGTNLAENINPCDVDPLSFIKPTQHNFTFQIISHDKIREIIMQMNTTKSSGYDKISVKLLQAAGNSIVGPLTHIFNQSLRTGIFPDEWKIAKITPIHKADEKNLCGNYRPVSVISVVSKVFEKVVYEQLMQYLEQHKIISKVQSGFRANHSTKTSLLHLTNEWLRNMDAGLINGVLFLDLKKAFDTINHTILLSKLECYGIRGLSLQWFESYLNNRKQICKVNNSLSTFQNVSCGIPQGSNLGPLLFLIYINDLPNSLEITEPAMFTDDTSLTATGETPAEIQNKLRREIQNVSSWLSANYLTLNEEKTEYMLIGSTKRLKQIKNDPIIKIKDHVIRRVYNKKVLGLEIDDKLKWTKHVEKQSKKISCSIAMLRKIKPYVPQTTLQTMYKSFVLPYFNYCSTVWFDGNKTHAEKMLKLQKSAARIITDSGFDKRPSEIFQMLKWTKIQSILKKRELIITFKSLKGMAPEYMTEMFSIPENQTYQLRHNHQKLYLPKPKTNFLKRSFPYRGAVLWNQEWTFFGHFCNG